MCVLTSKERNYELFPLASDQKVICLSGIIIISSIYVERYAFKV